MKVLIPTPLRSYTAGAAEVEGEGGTVGGLLDSLERSFPGIRFRMIDEQERIRPHILVFVGAARAPGLTQPLDERDRVQIVCALSGG